MELFICLRMGDEAMAGRTSQHSRQLNGTLSSSWTKPNMGWVKEQTNLGHSALVFRIFELLSPSWEVRIVWVGREGNYVADNLTALACGLPMGTNCFVVPPASVVPILEADVVAAGLVCVWMGGGSGRSGALVTTVVSPATSEARSILDRLSSVALCAIVDVCSALRDYCRNDHFWEKHMKQKWGKVIGDATDREWQ
ncbi:hypothetical protein V6N12_061456 [Hibiscus sabdariffa]|uniref:RNase H type-1 domain-containing protein n=1 Tax=Hibiscus sabdariffa TaxID=183260 RepID=A0ABR2DXQ3_9ROSI